MKIVRSDRCFKKPRRCNSVICMVAHPWSSNLHKKSVQSWSPGFSRNIGDFFRIFQSFQVGVLLILEIFQILILISSRPSKILDLWWIWTVLLPLETRILCILRSVIWSLFRSTSGAHVKDQQHNFWSPGVLLCWFPVLSSLAGPILVLLNHKIVNNLWDFLSLLDLFLFLLFHSVCLTNLY